MKEERIKDGRKEEEEVRERHVMECTERVERV